MDLQETFGGIGDTFRDRPVLAWGVTGAAVLGIGLAMWSGRRGTPDTGDGAESEQEQSRIMDVYGDLTRTPVGTVGRVGPYDPQTGTSPHGPNPPARTTIFRDGAPVEVTAAPKSLGMVCPPGYVSAQQPGQPPRCTMVDSRVKVQGQRQSFVPSKGETAFLDGTGKATFNT